MTDILVGEVGASYKFVAPNQVLSLGRLLINIYVICGL
jgi:hypothetical protein